MESLGLRYTHPENCDDSPLILITNTHTQLEHFKKLLPQTKLIIHPNSGYDNLARDYQLINDIPVVVGHEIRANAVAEWILGSFWEAALKRPVHQTWEPKRQWNRTLLHKKEVVIFGHGHIGKKVSASLKAIGLQVHIIDPYIENHHKSFKELEKKEYLALIVCCGLNDLNRQMFNKELFSHLSFDVFINGARGGLVNEQDLKDYLARHSDASAYLDVFAEEPFGEEWINTPQVIKSSHIAGVYQELDSALIDYEYKVLENFLNLDLETFKLKYHSELLSSKFREGVII